MGLSESMQFLVRYDAENTRRTVEILESPLISYHTVNNFLVAWLQRRRLTDFQPPGRMGDDGLMFFLRMYQERRWGRWKYDFGKALHVDVARSPQAMFSAFPFPFLRLMHVRHRCYEHVS